LTYQEFLQTWTHYYLGTFIDANWVRNTIESKWTPKNNMGNAQSFRFLGNPHYLIRFTKDTKIVVILTQPNKRNTGIDYSRIGIYLLPANSDGYEWRGGCKSKNFLAQTEQKRPQETLSYSGEAQKDVWVYVSIFPPDDEVPFTITILSENPVQIVETKNQWKEQVLDSTGEEKNIFDYPHYSFKLEKKKNLSFALDALSISFPQGSPKTLLLGVIKLDGEPKRLQDLDTQRFEETATSFPNFPTVRLSVKLSKGVWAILPLPSKGTKGKFRLSYYSCLTLQELH